MKNINITRILLAGFLLFTSFQSFAFWIYSDGGHPNITDIAAKKYSYKPSTNKYHDICSSDTGCIFTKPSISVFEDANRAIDGGGPTKGPAEVITSGGTFESTATHGIAKFHCDHEEIQECSNIIYNGRKHIVKRIISLAKIFKLQGADHDTGKLMAIIKNAHRIFGNIAHTLQDFYSHSNWVENKIHINYTPIIYTDYSYNGPLSIHEDPYEYEIETNGDLINQKFIYKKRHSLTTCETTASDTKLHVSHLTSGYYKKRPDIYGVDINSFDNTGYKSGPDEYRSEKSTYNGPYYVYWPYYNPATPDIFPEYRNPNEPNSYNYAPKPKKIREKCQHGDFLNAVGGNYDSTHFGLAKDSKGKRFHLPAKLAAIKATTQLIEAIIQDVKDAGEFDENTEAAILYFLGYGEKGSIRVHITDKTESGATNGYELSIINANDEVVKTVPADKEDMEADNILYFDVSLFDFPFKTVLSLGGKKEVAICSSRLNPRYSPQGFYRNSSDKRTFGEAFHIDCEVDRTLVDIDEGLVAHYKFEGNADDSSGNGNHGTENGTVEYIDGVIGKAAKFNSFQDILTPIELNGTIDNQYLTISFWGESSNSSAFRAFVTNYNIGDGHGSLLLGVDMAGLQGKASGLYGNGYCYSFFAVFLTKEISNTPDPCRQLLYEDIFDFGASTPLNSAILHHYVYQYNNETETLYVDGEILFERSVGENKVGGHNESTRYPRNDTSFDRRLRIGGYNNNFRYPQSQLNSVRLVGWIDELRIYKRVLNESEIQKLFH